MEGGSGQNSVPLGCAGSWWAAKYRKIKSDVEFAKPTTPWLRARYLPMYLATCTARAQDELEGTCAARTLFRHCEREKRHRSQPASSECPTTHTHTRLIIFLQSASFRPIEGGSSLCKISLHYEAKDESRQEWQRRRPKAAKFGACIHTRQALMNNGPREPWPSAAACAKYRPGRGH